MKKFFTLVLFVVICLHAMPQKGQVGFQISPIATFINTDDVNSSQGSLPPVMIYNQFKFGYKLGLNYNHMFTQKWALSPSFSFNYLVYGFKQLLYDNGAIASFTDDLGYGSFEISIISKHYMKINDNQFFVFKLGAAAASTRLWAYSSSNHLEVDSGGIASSYTNGSANPGTMYTPRIIIGASIVNSMQTKDKLEIGITYNHSFNPVADYNIIRSINSRKYSYVVAPVLSYFSLDIIYYLRPYIQKKEADKK